MGRTDKSLCDSCTNIGCEFQSGIVRTKCAFYMPPQLEPDNCGNYVVQDSTTKNDLGVDAVSRQAINIYIDFILNHGMGKKKSFDFIKKFVTNLPSVTPQEQFKPMVEIDLYSVIKQKYIEREVLDKIRAEIIDEKDFAYADFEQYKEAVLGADPDELPDDDFRYGMERAIEIINKYTNDKCDKGCDFCEHTSECMPS